MIFQSTGQRMAVFAFMALVTSAVHGLLIVELARGPDRVAPVAVYGVTAAFGIDYLVASWRSLWRDRRRTG
jgi:hypothetical protein